MAAKAKILVGTSGFHYEHWTGPFYPEGVPPKDFLKFYCKFFKTVELNNTFYRLPQVNIVKHWRDIAPARFIFAVKASRFITHIKRLHESQDALKMFFERIEPFDKKLGPILFQFPPKWDFNLERLAAFMPMLPKSHRYAFEFRHPGWFRQETYDLLEKHGAALCIYDFGGKSSPKVITGKFIYLRLHGAARAYQGNYPDSALSSWAADIKEWLKHKMDVYCYFNNDQAGYAVANAETLIKMVSGE